jgi:Flp pilus assembly protein TadG
MVLAIGEGLNYIPGGQGFCDSRHSSSKASKSKAGQGMVEFALTLPMLMLLMLGIIEFGRLLFTYSAVTTPAREAARCGSSAGGLDSTINNYQNLPAHRPPSQSAR